MPQLVSPAAQGLPKYRNLAVNTVATLAEQVTKDRKSISIFNNGPNNIYFGSDSTVTVNNGFPIPPQTSLTVEVGNANGLAQIYLIADTALQVSPADTRILELQ